MAPVIYRRQGQILGFIKQYIQSKGSAPTLREIADALGVSSLATVHEHLVTLEEKGLIKRRSGKTRAIELLGLSTISPEEGVDAQILGYIAAGAPIEPYTDPNATISIPSTFITGKKRVYVLQVRGESMIEEQIRDGDYVVVRKQETCRNGEIVVALVDGQEATLKKFYRERDRVRLEPANSTMKPIFSDNVQVMGVVVGVIVLSLLLAITSINEVPF